MEQPKAPRPDPWKAAVEAFAAKQRAKVEAEQKAMLDRANRVAMEIAAYSEGQAIERARKSIRAMNPHLSPEQLSEAAKKALERMRQC